MCATSYLFTWRVDLISFVRSLLSFLVENMNLNLQYFMKGFSHFWSVLCYLYLSAIFTINVCTVNVGTVA